MGTNLTLSSVSNATAIVPFTPKVSIGMPVYNGEPFISEALDSLLEQTFTNFELIISDNASTDGTEAICREYVAKDLRIRYVRHEKNRGAPGNFQFVLDEAVGEYFMWAAADDLQYPEFVDSLVSQMENNPSLCCVMSDVENKFTIESKEKQISILDDIRLVDIKKDWKKNRLRFFRNPNSNIFFCIYGLFRSSVLKEINLRQGNLKYAFSSELPLLAQVATIGPIASIPSVLKIYRRHDESLYHREQKSLSSRDRMKGFVQVSKALIIIIHESKLKFIEKIKLYSTVIGTSSRCLIIYFGRKLLHSIPRTK